MKLTALAAGVALATLVGTPAAAHPGISAVLVTGPSHVHDTAFTGARTTVSAFSTAGDGTVVMMTVTGLPERVRGTTLGTHVHVDQCGEDPGASGGHYANPDAAPGTPLSEKEIWLDIEVDAAGNGAAHTVVDWVIAPGDAESVVVHAEPTDPQTGDAGPRLFCTSVPFGA